MNILIQFALILILTLFAFQLNQNMLLPLYGCTWKPNKFHAANPKVLVGYYSVREQIKIIAVHASTKVSFSLAERGENQPAAESDEERERPADVIMIRTKG